jgi:hypothetical protein
LFDVDERARAQQLVEEAARVRAELRRELEDAPAAVAGTEHMPESTGVVVDLDERSFELELDPVARPERIGGEYRTDVVDRDGSHGR